MTASRRAGRLPLADSLEAARAALTPHVSTDHADDPAIANVIGALTLIEAAQRDLAAPTDPLDAALARAA